MENIKIQIAETRLKPLKVDGKSFLSSNDFQVTENDLENAREELNETNEIKVECLRKLRERLNSKAGLLFLLLLFYSTFEFSRIISYRKLLMYYTLVF